jgi:hypothetical protein
MEDRMRQLALTARPLTRPLLPGDPSTVRHRLTLYAAAARRTRALAAMPIPATARPVAALAGSTSTHGAEREPAVDHRAAAVAEATRALARVVSGLNDDGPGADPAGQRTRPGRHGIPRASAGARLRARPRR